MIVEVGVSEVRHPVQTVVRAVIHAVRALQTQICFTLDYFDQVLAEFIVPAEATPK